MEDNGIIAEIRETLFSMKDSEYKELQAKILPALEPDAIIGVRTPQLRKYAKQLSKDSTITRFLDDLPHKYFEEDQLHAFIISEIKDYTPCVCEVNRFLPHVNNWATCDQMVPKVFKKRDPDLMENIKIWLESTKTYAVRFGIKMLMDLYLDDEHFDISYAEAVASIKSEEYYINMMIAWYFATALAYRYDEILPFIEEHRLDDWTHNKAIQKSVESFRITGEQKDHLRSLKVARSKITRSIEDEDTTA